MTRVILRGDAPTKPKTIIAQFNFFESGDLIRAVIGLKKIEYRASSNEGAASGLATLINASRLPEFQELTASSDGNQLTLQALTAGKPFFITFETQESDSILVSVAETTPGIAPTNEVQRHLVSGTVTGGTLTYSNDFGSGTETSSAIAYDATASEIKAAIVAGCASVTSADLSVAGDALDFFITWQGTYGASEVAEGSLNVASLTGTGSAVLTKTVDGRGLSDEVVVVDFTGGGSGVWDYTLSFGGQTTATLDQDDGAAEIKTAFEALSSVGSGNVDIYTSQRPDGNKDRMIVIRFKGSLGGTNVGPVTVASVSDGVSRVGVVQAGGAATTDEVQFVNLDSEQPTSGDTYTLTLDGDETTALAMTASPATLEAALEALDGVSEVQVNSGNALIKNTNGFVVRFKGTQADTDVSLMVLDTSGLDSPGSPSVSEVLKGEASVNEQWQLVINGLGGTFAMGDGTDTSPALAYNISAATLETEIETDLGLYPGVSVTGTGTALDPFVIEVTSPAATDVGLLTADGAGLTGASGAVTEETAHDAGTSEVQTITIGVGVTGGTWTATALGQLLGPFDHDELSATVQTALLSAYGSGNVSVSGAAGGPYVVTFAGDYASAPMDPIEVDGTALIAGSGSELVTVIQTQKSQGPQHADDPANWTTGIVPETGDDLMIEDGTEDLLYGLNWLSEFTATAATDVLSISQCDFADEQKVRLTTTGTLPAGLAVATDYYVILISDTSIKLSATRGGSPVDITDAGSGVHTIAVELASYTRRSDYTGKIGLSKRNTDGTTYYEYRNRKFRFGIQASGDKKVVSGTGEGSGGPREYLHTGAYEIDAAVYKSGGSDEPGVPAFQHTGENSQSLVTVYDAECGFAFNAGEVAEYRKIMQHGGLVNLGAGSVNADLFKTDGDLIANDANFSGVITILG